MCRQQPLKVAPALLYIHKAANESYSPVIEYGKGKEKISLYNFAQLEDSFAEHLKTLLTEIFNPDVPFEQTTITEKCLYCDYKSICKR